MRLLLRCVIVACVCLLAVTPAWAQNSGGLPGKEHPASGRAYEQAERVVLLDDDVHGEVVHYQFDVPVGPGPFDVIRMHRVVKEVSPGRPAKKMEGILLLPGLPADVRGHLHAGGGVRSTPETEFGRFYLALNDIDVWGMDYGHSFIPYPSTEFRLLQGMGNRQGDAAHVHIALVDCAMASRDSRSRAMVRSTSSGSATVDSWSTRPPPRTRQQPGNLRNIKGIMPVDGTPVKLPMGRPRSSMPATPRSPTLAALDAGTYHLDSSSTLKMGLAALNYPDDPSPLSGAAVPPPPAPPVFPRSPRTRSPTSKRCTFR